MYMRDIETEKVTKIEYKILINIGFLSFIQVNYWVLKVI